MNFFKFHQPHGSSVSHRPQELFAPVEDELAEAGIVGAGEMGSLELAELRQRAKRRAGVKGHEEVKEEMRGEKMRPEKEMRSQKERDEIIKERDKAIEERDEAQWKKEMRHNRRKR